MLMDLRSMSRTISSLLRMVEGRIDIRISVISSFLIFVGFSAYKYIARISAVQK